MTDIEATADIIHKAQTLVAYTINLAQGAILTEFEIDNVIALAKALGLDIGMYRDKMLRYSASLTSTRADMAALKQRAEAAEAAVSAMGARSWWQRLLSR